MKKIVIAAVSVLALSGIVQARAEGGLAAVEQPATTGTVLSAPSLRDAGSEGYQGFAGPSVPVLSGQVLPTNGSARTGTILAKTVFNGVNNTPNATGGIEQSVWDPNTQSF